MEKNMVIVRREDEWSDLADFLGKMIVKYAAEMKLESMPDPDVYLCKKEIIDFLIKYRKYLKDR